MVLKRFNIILIIIPILLCYTNSIVAQTEEIRDTIQAATITDFRKVSSAQLTKITGRDIKPVISAMGEANAIGFIKMLPGISSGVEGSNSFYVRGGNNGNNLVSIDGVTLYGAGHLLGFTSAVSNSMIESSEFEKGGFSSEDGNFIASHLKFKLKDGDMDKIHMGASISNVMIGAWCSAPVVKDKLSVMVNMRYSPIQAEYNMFSKYWKDNEFLPEKILASVYDVSGKLRYVVSNRSSFSLTALYTYDNYSYDFKGKSYDEFGWKNVMISGLWDYAVNNDWSFKAGVSYNSFGSHQSQQRSYKTDSPLTEIGISNSIYELKFTFLTTCILDDYSTFQLGAEGRFAEFTPGSFKNLYNSARSDSGNETMKTFLGALNGEYRFSNGRFALKAGARLNYFKNDASSYFNPEARLSIDYKIKPQWGVELTADYLNQYYHTLEGIPTGFSTDMIVPAGVYADAERSTQIYIGTYAQITDNVNFTIGGFYKKMDNLVFFKEASNIFGSNYAGWKNNLDIGKGSSYGIEFSAEKTGEALTVKASYTLSKTDRIYPNINWGKSIPFKFDRPHIISANGVYDFYKTDKITHSALLTFSFYSGHCESLQSGYYKADGVPGFEDVDIEYFTYPNNYRVPDYIRLDAGYMLSVRGNKVRHNLTIGCFNVFNRHNTYSLYWDSESQIWKQISILPIMPNINYVVEF